MAAKLETAYFDFIEKKNKHYEFHYNVFVDICLKSKLLPVTLKNV